MKKRMSMLYLVCGYFHPFNKSGRTVFVDTSYENGAWLVVPYLSDFSFSSLDQIYIFYFYSDGYRLESLILTSGGTKLETQIHWQWWTRNLKSHSGYSRK